MSRTKIEWCDATWNPVRGCTKISPGCKHCYAEAFAERWRGVEGHPYELGFDPRLVHEKLTEPLGWRKPRSVFVNSMSDLFHAGIPVEFIEAVFGVMGACAQHTFKVLTKRADTMLKIVGDLSALADAPHHVAHRAFTATDDQRCFAATTATWPFRNVQLGVSVEDREYGVPRIAELRATPAAVRFISAEPLLEDLGELDLTGIHQVIVGAESGAGRRARPMDRAWVRRLRDQCREQGVAFFYKQEYGQEGGSGRWKKVSLPFLDGQQWMQQPGLRPLKLRQLAPHERGRIELAAAGHLPEPAELPGGDP